MGWFGVSSQVCLASTPGGGGLRAVRENAASTEEYQLSRFVSLLFSRKRFPCIQKLSLCHRSCVLNIEEFARRLNIYLPVECGVRVISKLDSMLVTSSS